MKRNWRSIILPDRRWVASITRTEGGTYTTVIYGPNASEAERRAEADPSIARAIIRSEIQS